MINKRKNWRDVERLRKLKFAIYMILILLAVPLLFWIEIQIDRWYIRWLLGI